MSYTVISTEHDGSSPITSQHTNEHYALRIAELGNQVASRRYTVLDEEGNRVAGQPLLPEPAEEVQEHGFTVGQRIYTTNSQWPEIDFVGEFTFNDKPYVKGIHSEWGVAGHFHLSEVSATAPLAGWEKELLRALPQGDPDALKQESEAPFAREGVIYRSRLTGMNYKISEGKLRFGIDWELTSCDYALKDVTPDNFEIVAEPGAELAEELPPVSRKHFDESKAAGERRRQKLITHVEELQAKLSEKNKVIAQREATLRSIRNLVV